MKFDFQNGRPQKSAILTYPEKTKGLIVTFRKPYTMEHNVQEATKVYSDESTESTLIYPTYEDSKKRFKKAHKELKAITANIENINEHTPIETRVEFVKAFQELNNSYDALVTYNEYNDDIEYSTTLKDQVMTIEESVGVYNTVKGSLMDDEESAEPEVDFSDIEFHGENATKIYDIDATYIDKLLETYSANNKNIRDDIENALQKLEKAEIVKNVYRAILNAIDNKEVDEEEDIFIVKRAFFTEEKNNAIDDFADTWFVEKDALHLSAIQYVIGMDPILNISDILNSRDSDQYKAANPDAKALKYGPEMKRQWRMVLDQVIIPLDDELR